MSDSFRLPASPSPAQRTPSRRETLWAELEHLHERLLMDPPTATLTLEDLEAEVERVRLFLTDVQDSSSG